MKILLSAFDTEKGKIQIAFLQAWVPPPKTTDDYKNSVFYFNLDQINPIHELDL